MKAESRVIIDPAVRTNIPRPHPGGEKTRLHSDAGRTKQKPDTDCHFYHRLKIENS